MIRAQSYAWIFAIALAARAGAPGFAQQPASTEIAGGSGGALFSDKEPPRGARVLEVRIRSGEQVDSVQMVFTLPGGGTVTSPQHGGSGGKLNVFRLDPGEHIIGLSGRYGDYIDSVRIHTDRRTSRLFGGSGGNSDYQINVPEGYQAVGFAGRSGDYLDAVGLIFTRLREGRISQTMMAGGSGGSVFSDDDIAPGARIAEVRVHAGEQIDAIQAVYVLPDGRFLEGARHGGRGGRISVFRLDSEEYIVGLSGRCGEYVDSVRVHTNKRASPPFGGGGGDRDFRIDVPPGNQAVGFAGRAGDYLDAIGLTFSETGPPWPRFPGRRRGR